MKWPSLLSSLLLSLLITPIANAGVEETTRETDTHIIHFNVFNSSMLTPEIANQYGLKRSKYHSMLNLAIHEKGEPEGSSEDNSEGTSEVKPVPAILKGTVTNIVQQQRVLEFQEIQEGRSIYYISDFRVTDDDLLTFDINIRTSADSPGYDLRFKRRVFTEQ